MKDKSQKTTQHSFKESKAWPSNSEQTREGTLSNSNQELLNDLQRTRADFENYRKQMDIQKAQAVAFAKYETVKKVLPLLDDLDRAIAATPELSPLAKNLEKTLADLKIQKVDSAPGTIFNPDFHDAIMMEESEGEKEVVAETLRAGYMYEGNVIRPAMVKVKNI